MDDKDSFLTVGYKTGYIHTCCNRTTGKTEVKSHIGCIVAKHATVVGAKRHITREIKRQDAMNAEE